MNNLKTAGVNPGSDDSRVHTVQTEEQEEVFKPFSKAQQAKVDEIVKDAMARAGRPFRQRTEQLETELCNLHEENKRLSARVNDLAPPAEQEAERQRELAQYRAQLKAKDEESTNYKREAQKIRLESAIQKAANNIGFVSLELVMKDTADLVRYNEEFRRFEVIGKDGNVRLNTRFEPMGLEEFYKAYAAEHPYLVRADARPGTGSSDGGRAPSQGPKLEELFGKGSNAKLANELAKSDYKLYMKLREQAKAKGLI
jgi:hypothetical protein